LQFVRSYVVIVVIRPNKSESRREKNKVCRRSSVSEEGGYG